LIAGSNSDGKIKEWEKKRKRKEGRIRFEKASHKSTEENTICWKVRDDPRAQNNPR